ncbi:KilA-N domain-containing protein [Fusobacterium animalis]|uniref:KilA-N domain-containing protein n=1 Tax=Fusobacterium animalis TaxID=76859 RepID=UPI0030CFF2CB
MSNMKKETIEAKGLSIQVYIENFKNNYISLTNIAKYKNKEKLNVVEANWLRNRNTIEYLGIWEKLNNVDIKKLKKK